MATLGILYGIPEDPVNMTQYFEHIHGDGGDPTFLQPQTSGRGKRTAVADNRQLLAEESGCQEPF